jgi:hypothetical protein
MSSLSSSSNSLIDTLIKWNFLPDSNTFGLPDSKTPIPTWPFNFQNDFLKNFIYPLSLNGYVPISIAIIYFTTVHICNENVLKRQINYFKKTNPNEKLPKNLKKLKAVPYKITKFKIFNLLVLIHNIFLCVYSVWTFIGMTSTMYHLSNKIFPSLFKNIKSSPISNIEAFWQTICNNNDINNNLWKNYDDVNLKGLTFYAYLFYLSKYYEILDTIIILLKGRPSSLLQSYHHSGAILCMWSGTRYMSSPIWIFVVFNSFIHSIMYAYFSLSCLKIRLPKWFKQSLTTLQILQFIIGGSLAFIHLFVRYYDSVSGSFNSCIATSEQAIAVYINVFYLAPLTLLFAAFYIDSYKKKMVNSKKND